MVGGDLHVAQVSAGDDDGTALWMATGQQIRDLATGSINIDSVAFSPDGKTLATGGADGTATLWNPAARILVEVNVRHGRTAIKIVPGPGH